MSSAKRWPFRPGLIVWNFQNMYVSSHQRAMNHTWGCPLSVTQGHWSGTILPKNVRTPLFNNSDTLAPGRTVSQPQPPWYAGPVLIQVKVLYVYIQLIQTKWNIWMHDYSLTEITGITSTGLFLKKKKSISYVSNNFNIVFADYWAPFTNMD